MIIDGAHENIIELSKENLDWCCGEDSTYEGILLGYEMKIPNPNGNRKKRQRQHGYSDRKTRICTRHLECLTL